MHTVARRCRYPSKLTCQQISHTAQALNREWTGETREQTPSRSTMLCGGCLARSNTTKCKKNQRQSRAPNTLERLWGVRDSTKGMKGRRRCWYNPFATLSSIPPPHPPLSQITLSVHSPAALHFNTPCCLTFQILLFLFSDEEHEGKLEKKGGKAAWKRRDGSRAEGEVR